MKKSVIVFLTVLLLISETVSAADIYVCTRDTSQGAVFEYYVREETCRVVIDKDQKLCADIITVRKDKWGRTVPPLIVEWQFFNFSTDPIFVKCDKKTGYVTECNAVKNDPIAYKVFETIKGVISQ